MAIESISVSPQGTAGTGGNSAYPILSPDGTKVAFVSQASNLVAGDNNNQADLFVRDLTTNVTTRVSTDAANGESTGGGGVNTGSLPAFSPDGTKIAFVSGATNLVTGDTNGQPDVFIKDLVSGAITRVNVTAGGAQAATGGGVTSIGINGVVFSPDGTKVAFATNAPNLVGGDTNAGYDVFVKDLGAGGAVTRVSTNASNQQTGDNTVVASQPQFSPDGTRIAFLTGAQMVPGDTNTLGDLYVKNLTSGAVTRVNVDENGNQAATGATGFRFSPTGDKIAFTSSSALVSGDTNGVLDIYMKDLTSGVLTRISTTSTGAQANGASSGTVLSFSADGTKIAFSSAATNLTGQPDGNGVNDIFVKDLVTGTVTRVSVQGDGSEASGGGSTQPWLSPDGSKVVFASTATNLTPTDTNNQQDIFRADTVCFAQGTHIATARGAVAVEELRVGEDAVTASGAMRPIRWIGQRTMTCRGRRDALPVRIAEGAFGEGRPARDLSVSPAHAIAVDVLGEVLIPAIRLVNGTTITQVEVETVTYWHVELDSHDLLVAEGLPAESYLDCGNRRFFANAEATDLLAAPDVRPDGPLPFCRPFHEAGSLVDLVRGRLRERAEALGWHRVADTFGGLHLVADGETIRPDVEGLTARFVLPAAARDVRLVSTPSVPAHVVPGSTDRRRLGLPLARLTLDDGLTGIRTVALDDPRLGAGFHAVEGGRRWTDGAATLPADLWAGCRGTVFLRMTLGGPALPRWVAPQDEAQGEAAGTRDPAERYRA